MCVNTVYHVWGCACPQVAWGAGRKGEEGKFSHRFGGGRSPCTAAQPRAAGETPSALSLLLQQMLSPRTPKAPTAWRVRLPGITSSSVSRHLGLPHCS